MVYFSVIIPGSTAAPEGPAELQEVEHGLLVLARPFEILWIDPPRSAEDSFSNQDHSAPSASVRILSLKECASPAGRIKAAIEAARGEVVISVPASSPFPLEPLNELVSRLSRFDLVFAKPRRPRLVKLWQRVLRLPRMVLLGEELHDPDCMFWAARREAIAGVDFVPISAQRWAVQVSQRGYRVGEVPLSYLPSPSLLSDRPRAVARAALRTEPLTPLSTSVVRPAPPSTAPQARKTVRFDPPDPFPRVQ